MFRELLRDLATLRLPVTAAAALATLLALVAPFGLQLGAEQTASVTGAIVAFGVIADAIRRRLDRLHTAALEITPHPVNPSPDQIEQLAERAGAASSS